MYLPPFLSPPPPLLPKVLAILTFSLTADYSPSASRNSIQCNGLSLSIGASYPYDSSSFSFSSNSSNVTCTFSTKAFSGSAQYFVGMGVLTFLYLVLAVAAYVLLVNTLFAYAHYILIAVRHSACTHAETYTHSVLVCSQTCTHNTRNTHNTCNAHRTHEVTHNTYTTHM